MADKAENAKPGTGTEYEEPKPHNHVKSNYQRDIYMVFQTDNNVYFFTTHQNRQVKVTLTFSGQSDQKAEQEFISRLKAVYLEKVETGVTPNETSAFQSPAPKDKEEKHNG